MFVNISYNLNFVTCVPEAVRLGGIGAITAQTSAVLAHGISWSGFGFGGKSEYGIGICWYAIGMF